MAAGALERADERRKALVCADLVERLKAQGRSFGSHTMLRPKTQPNQSPISMIDGDGHHGQSDQNRMPVRHAIHVGGARAINDVKTHDRGPRERKCSTNAQMDQATARAG